MVEVYWSSELRIKIGLRCGKYITERQREHINHI